MPVQRHQKRYHYTGSTQLARAINTDFAIAVLWSLGVTGALMHIPLGETAIRIFDFIHHSPFFLPYRYLMIFVLVAPLPAMITLLLYQATPGMMQHGLRVDRAAQNPLVLMVRGWIDTTLMICSCGLINLSAVRLTHTISWCDALLGYRTFSLRSHTQPQQSRAMVWLSALLGTFIFVAITTRIAAISILANGVIIGGDLAEREHFLRTYQLQEHYRAELAKNPPTTIPKAIARIRTVVRERNLAAFLQLCTHQTQIMIAMIGAKKVLDTFPDRVKVTDERQYGPDSKIIYYHAIEPDGRVDSFRDFLPLTKSDGQWRIDGPLYFKLLGLNKTEGAPERATIHQGFSTPPR